MADKVNVKFFDSGYDGLIPLTPENVRKMSDEGLEEFLAWIVSAHEASLEHKQCPFCGIAM